jgi:alginate O-acetyltransferase complex protein AlgJ
VFEALQPPELAEEITYAPTDTAETKEIVGRVERLLVAMVELSRARGVELVAVMIPTREQVNPQIAPRGRERDWEKPQRHFRAFFERAGVPFVDLLPPVRAAQGEAPLYYRFDAHWNARAHALAAETVAAFLKTQNLADALARP